MTTATQLRFSRWQKNDIDRVYVNGLGTVEKFWLETTASGDYQIKTSRRHLPNDDAYAVDCNRIHETLAEIFGGSPAWQQIIDACN